MKPGERLGERNRKMHGYQDCQGVRTMPDGQGRQGSGSKLEPKMPSHLLLAICISRTGTGGPGLMEVLKRKLKGSLSVDTQRYCSALLRPAVQGEGQVQETGQGAHPPGLSQCGLMVSLPHYSQGDKQGLSGSQELYCFVLGELELIPKLTC